jgi:hypothetical protein
MNEVARCDIDPPRRLSDDQTQRAAPISRAQTSFSRLPPDKVPVDAFGSAGRTS